MRLVARMATILHNNIVCCLGKKRFLRIPVTYRAETWVLWLVAMEPYGEMRGAQRYSVVHRTPFVLRFSLLPRWLIFSQKISLMAKCTLIDFVRGASAPPSNSYGMVSNFRTVGRMTLLQAALAAETEHLLSILSNSINLITVST